MGKGISLAFAYAGYPVALIDSEHRSDDAFDDLQNVCREEIDAELGFLDSIGILTPQQVSSIQQRIRIVAFSDAPQELSDARFVFEAVVELREIKQGVYAWLNDFIDGDTIVSSTTSTMSANDLVQFIDGDQRFVNAHWLNPAHLIPLVEVSPADGTSPQVVDAMRSLLEEIGKVPVVCRASPGFIISRIQAVALNEAARVVEEGVASAEDVDRAITSGFGIRYATLGMLEFIDFGGGDILYHATNYLGANLDRDRFSVPRIVRENMENDRNGLRDGEGFYQWRDRDVDDYRRRKMTEFVRLLEHRNLMPKLGAKGEN